MESQLWPVHPQPLHDELLSSWMIRIAKSNGFKVHNFYAHFFGKEREIWTRDIDHCAPEWLIHGLAKFTGISSQRISAMGLRGFESFVFERFNEVGVTKFLLPLSVFHRTRRAYGQQYCPICFSEDRVPYLRRSWRLALFVICSKHGVLLEDRCSECNRPVVPHRADMANRSGFPENTSMARCAFCGASLMRVATTVALHDLEMQRHFEHVLSEGFAKINGAVQVYSHLYFEGLRVLMLGLSKFDTQGSGNTNFERASIENRLVRLRTALELLDHWPDRFLDFCARVKAPYSAFCRDSPQIPYWLGSVLRRHVFNAYASISISEMASIMQVAERDGTTSIRTRIRQVSGRDPTRFLPLTKGIDDDVADILLASIDQEITGLNEKKRAILLRDKVMFITARCLKLNVSQLLRHQTKSLQKKEYCMFSFWDRVETWGQVEAMLCWYQNCIRPIICSGQCTSLFTTSNGKPLRHSAVGARFHRAVRLASLERTILDWKYWITNSKTSL
nr:TniQ family protein [uncultured Undibacterium sp.]